MSLSHVQLFATPGTVACQAPPSVGFSRQEYWSGLPFSSPGDLPNPGIESWSPPLQADSFPKSHQMHLLKANPPGWGQTTETEHEFKNFKILRT